MTDGTDDPDLVKRCVDGDREAFAPLVARYERPLFNVALRMVGDREDARDITQTAFVKAYQKLGSYDPRYRFFSWIYRIAINECLNHRARRRRSEALDPQLRATQGDPERAAEAGELDMRIRAALAALPLDQRLALVLRYFLDLSYDEMSEILLVPEKTVKSRLHEARERMGSALQRAEAPPARSHVP
ncbi:MAG TPA: sigma-70 family RNA polymerase sigma factor [Vicinamibacteria bacterium]|nr:sigma-70 family RNA polymerase sigma factor [Vicinamibacteria bacterium]